MKTLKEILLHGEYKSFVKLKNNVIEFYNAPEYIKVKLLIELTELLKQEQIEHEVNKDFDIVLY